jgi:bifunctional non-homologous end joining protein LigD
MMASVASANRRGITMVLEEYRAKRDFRKTPEPAVQRGKPHVRPIFVIQEHHASRLHYDFRLEADGVLKSWAVPKAPSLDPAQKRLAVRVEDHPLAYASFEGTIPKGQYGAGTVTIWDHGTYENLLAQKPDQQTVKAGIEAGRLEFRLHGRKLRGKFALIRMRGKGRGKENWLLIKMKDEFARPEIHDDKPPMRKAVARNERKTVAATQRATPGPKPPRRLPAVTNPDKLFYPDAGITKGEVFAFYRRVARHLLPHLRDRPATLERLPEGLGDSDTPHFWQKDTPAYYPDWIRRIDLPSERGKRVHYVLINDLATLLYLVNQGALTFHVWFSRITDLDRPDFVLFDLDPGRADFADAVAVARQLHNVLTAERREGFLKTSGKTGLHVLTAWKDEGGYDEARAWASVIAERVVEALPNQATLERGKVKRGRRVYLDVMQNAKGHHAVPPYVLRAVPGATVSTPLNWRELTPALDPAEFNLKTIFRRLARLRRDPLAGLVQAFAGS